MPSQRKLSPTAALTGLLSLTFGSSAAYAYVGPGAGLSAIGSVLSFIGVVLLMIVGFVWYPAKRLIKKMRAKKQESSEQDG